MKARILALLEQNARMSFADIAIMMGITEAEVAAIVEKCEEDGELLGYHANVDWQKVGTPGVTALIELKTIPQKGRGFDDIAERICNFEEVQSVCLMSGGFDLAITVECDNMRDVALFVAEKLATIEGVTATATHFQLQKYKDNGVIYGTETVDKRGNNW